LVGHTLRNMNSAVKQARPAGPREGQEGGRRGGYRPYTKPRSSYDVNDGPRRGTFQQQHTPAGASDKKKDYEIFDKTRDILRCIFPMNKSAGKTVILAMDPNFNFQPMVTFSKTGKPGVKMTAFAFRNLCRNTEYITDFFTEHHDGEQVVNLSPETVVSFEKQYGKKVLVFTTEINTNESRSVVIQEPTWTYLKTLFGLLNLLIDQQETYTKDAQQLYDDLIRYCKSYFTAQQENHTDMSRLEEFLREVTLMDIGFAAPEECYLDVERAFLEMKLFCIYDLAGSL